MEVVVQWRPSTLRFQAEGAAHSHSGRLVAANMFSEYSVFFPVVLALMSGF
jgi:hypothetical protein